MIKELLPLAIGYIVTDVSLSWLIPKLERAGIVGEDVHKPDKPKVAEMGGISVILGVLSTFFSLTLLKPNIFRFIIPIVVSMLISASIGLIDDLISIKDKLKPIISALPSIPLLTSNVLHPYPKIPFIGSTRLTISYFLFIPIYVDFIVLGANMIDVMNGVLSLSSVIILLSSGVSCVLMGDTELLSVAIFCIPSLLAFFKYNKYPAKVFSGNIGSFAIGAILASTSLICRVEVPFVIAALPLLINGFSYLISVRSIKGRGQLPRPVKIEENGKIRAIISNHIPITLVGLLTLSNPKTEREVIHQIHALFIISSLLAILTTLTIP